ncbi:RsmB/NOP family class I SAM-dependent RNA methyltransferase [Rhodospirillaceae bacterium KN72]|uniref:RsmB/NOP family class I SAM-dependent RNA methyltransferase n=1 Tax=Pacificispira spongiicola TaxID=2729598 RepID=A0A7Y0E2N3_9PROT|nr:RsmB/NOP family class I SAM-dependent RNA methyltransferase [Pacificispira spongiicola]NMM46120.1 RsmB/NOP family class I SAM-dependent RNA methyltransferase [Pacificispira spongiicola]
MTPGARMSAAITLLSRLDGPDAPPADKLLADWARANRYAGSKDKSAIAAMVYGCLRRRGQIDWWLSRCKGDEPAARPRLLVWMQLAGEAALSDLERFCSGEKFDPPPLTPVEKRVAVELSAQKGFDLSCQPVSIGGNMPVFLEQDLIALYGAETSRQLAAHDAEAPVDLRVNTLKADRDTVRAALAEAGIDSAPTPYSPIGLRLTERKPLSGTAVFKDGLIEPQDEGSQLAALLVEAKPGMKIVDFCAGAGGKTLALAATMNNTGRIIACDVSEARLKRAGQRLKRAGAFLVERRPLSSERDKWVKRRAARFDGGFDRVLVDAPCSGSGTWRRNPDQKWKLTPDGLAEVMQKQSSVLESAARLVAPGGRLIYVTCSILKQENEDRVDAFLAEHGDFYAHPVSEIWSETLPDVAFPGAPENPYLRLTPADHGTDGFFVAVLGRKLT